MEFGITEPSKDPKYGWDIDEITMKSHDSSNYPTRFYMVLLETPPQSQLRVAPRGPLGETSSRRDSRCSLNPRLSRPWQMAGRRSPSTIPKAPRPHGPWIPWHLRHRIFFLKLLESHQLIFEAIECDPEAPGRRILGPENHLDKFCSIHTPRYWLVGAAARIHIIREKKGRFPLWYYPHHRFLAKTCDNPKNGDCMRLQQFLFLRYPLVI